MSAPVDRLAKTFMGCLPIPILFVLGVLAGEWLGGDRGALWGAGIGLLLGVILFGIFIVKLRQRR
ncbi:hypothetical protein [Dyella agri]|uniref:AtpZ/AtpI family protein n=1 Tax=Dyella agri TaxID=1926869 RepID=A0ABW8KHE9_9GAMM